MRRLMVAGNWKMNASAADTNTLVGGIINGLGDASNDREVLVCPPFPYLRQAHERIGAAASVALGGQDVDTNLSGAFTGAVSAAMLIDCGCSHVIVGHSERRSLYHDTDDLVAAKTEVAINAGLTPVVCIGETLEQREHEQTESVLEAQLGAVIARIGVGQLSKTILAYEPVWAIGTGKTASPAQAQAVHAFVREYVRREDGKVADGVRILYGGSVKGENAAGLFKQPDIDGGLIGGASLKATDFLDIVNAM